MLPGFLRRYRRWLSVFTLVLFAVTATAASAARIVRGPYLQQPSDSQIIIRWRTDNPSRGTLYFGAAPGATTHHGSESEKKIEHELRLRGLAPATRYYYSIHDESGEIAGGSDYFFETSPAPGSEVATRIWVLGDPGDQSGEEARAVRDAYLANANGKRTDFMLLLGDNAYGSGLDRQYQVAVFERFRKVLRNTPVWSVIGNHESNKPGTRENSSDSVYQTGPYYEMFSFPVDGVAGGVASGTEAYYSFDYGNVHVIVLDSYFSVDRREGFRDRMIAWLKSDLANNTAKWTIAAWHHSPYSKGSHDADHGSIETHMRSVIVPILEAHGVDLVLTGHSHAYERSGLLHGLYGKSTTLADHPEYMLDGSVGPYRKGADGKGTVYVVAGNASSVSSKGRLDHPAMVVSRRELGSLAIDIAGDTLTVSMISDSGQISDRFSIVKSEGGATGEPDSEAAGGGDGQTAPADATDGASGGGAQPDNGSQPDATATTGNDVAPENGDTSPLRVVERRIPGGRYDVEERAWGTIYFDSSDLEMVNDKWDQTVGLRFNKLALPAGATIEKAWIQFEADEENARETTLYIHGEKTAYSKKFAASKWNLSNRKKTDRYASWMPEPWLTRGRRGGKQRSPDLSAVIQEIVDDTAWKSGNAMTFIITGQGKRVARSFESGAGRAPLLHIEYR